MMQLYNCIWAIIPNSFLMHGGHEEPLASISPAADLRVEDDWWEKLNGWSDTSV